MARKLQVFSLTINKSEFPAPCGCVVRFDNDGLCRLAWCDRHAAVNDPVFQTAITEAKAALVGDSNDAEHDALFKLMQALGCEVPDCECETGPVGNKHSEDCPCKAWGKPNECQHMTGYWINKDIGSFRCTDKCGFQFNTIDVVQDDRRVISAGRGRA